MKRLTLILLFVMAIFHLTKGENRYVYSQISQTEGLASTVNCICKEKDGDVWIGTPNGLYSFNGHSLKHYDFPIFDGCQINHTKIDNKGNLWVLSSKSIAVRFNNSNSFTKITNEDEHFYSIVDGGESIWFGGPSGIYEYSFKNNNLSRLCALPKGFDGRTLSILDDNTLLTCSLHGKLLINIADRSIKEAPFGTNKEIAATLVDSRGYVWMASYNKGIEIFDKSGRKIKSYNSSNSELSNNIVLCLAERDGKIMAGTDGGGINIINIDTDEIYVMTHISGNPYSFPAHSIKCIHIDEHKNIWAGSIRDGLIKIGQSGICTYRDTHIGLSDGLSNPSTLCLYQDPSSEYIWIGTDGEGINRFNPKTREFTHYPQTLKKKVVSIASYSENELALSIYSEHILIFNKITGRVRTMNIDNKDLLYLIKYTGRSINLYNENDGNLLLIGNSIYRYDKNHGKCTNLTMPDGEKADGNFHIIGKTDDGIWLHDNFHIYFLENKGKFPIKKATHKEHIIKSGHIESATNTLWLATEEGLCRYSINDKKFSHINTSLYDGAISVLCDKQSIVWIGTTHGLYAYLTETGIFTLFGESDGAAPNEFLPKPRLLAANGDIYLGGVRGLLHIESNYDVDTSEEPEVILHEVLVDGKSTPLKSGEELEISRGSKTISIGVSTMEKDLFRHKAYRFYLNDNILSTGTDPILTLNQLPPPGKYEISVSCTKRNGEWTPPARLMTMNIPKPWYKTWWFIGSIVGFITCIFTYVIFSYNRKRLQDMQVALKEEKQKVYEEKVRMLINISHELRTPLTLIMAPLKRILNNIDSDNENHSTLVRVYRQSRRMKHLLDMVLDLRKKEVTGDIMKIESVNYNNWIKESIIDIADEEKVEGINIIYELDPLIMDVDIDKQKCDVVLMNTLMNAIKHSTTGDTITVKTTLTEEGFIRTSISDQGPGLGKDIDPQKMFTRFYQSNSEQYGSGIGLAYSKILVEMHKGKIGVENNPDKGATFWWLIPMKAVDDTDTPETRAYINELLGHSAEAILPVDVEKGFSTANMKIMLVDDSQDLLDFLKESLYQDFAMILTATSGKNAIKQLEEGKLPDIIISDVNMPDGDGFWLCDELKQNEKYRHIPTILLTARGEEQSQSLSYRLGADAFMAKPFEIETLMELIRNMLRGKFKIKKKYLDNDASEDVGYSSSEERFILQLNKIVADHLSDPGLDQQYICMELGMSRALLYNKMKSITGAGTKEYITKIRIEKAKSLIETTSLTIAEISDMTGFASQSYFSTAFKNYTGMTPSQYKQHAKQQDNEND